MDDLTLKLAKDIITVEVPSSRGGYHKVKYNIITDEYSCTCEDFFYRGRICKHIKIAKDFIEETLHITTSNDVANGEASADNDIVEDLLFLKNELSSLKRENPNIDLRESYKTLNRLLASQRV